MAVINSGPVWNGGPIVGGYQLTEATAITPATQAPGRSVLLNASTAGDVSVVMLDGSTLLLELVLGDNIYPFAITKATTVTAVIRRYYNLVG